MFKIIVGLCLGSGTVLSTWEGLWSQVHFKLEHVQWLPHIRLRILPSNSGSNINVPLVIFISFFSSTLDFISPWIVTARIFKEDRHCQGRKWCWASREHIETETQCGKDLTRLEGAVSPRESALRAQAVTLLIPQRNLDRCFISYQFCSDNSFLGSERLVLLEILSTELNLLLLCRWKKHEKHEACWNINAF